MIYEENELSSWWVGLVVLAISYCSIFLMSLASLSNFGECRFRVTHNVLGLWDGGELDTQMFSLAQMFNRIPNVQFSTEAPLLQNLC
jgi:hypothetical protein